jgi:uncharacterized membrane protein YqaE (UPF0057 family)
MAEKLPDWVKTKEDYFKWEQDWLAGKYQKSITEEGAPVLKSIKKLSKSFIHALCVFVNELLSHPLSVCTSCGYMGRPKKITKGNFIIELILWCLFIIPGLIYSIWRLTAKYNVCPQCKHATMIPESSPFGRELVNKIRNMEGKFAEK